MSETIDIEQTEIEPVDTASDDYPTGMLANPTRVRS